MATSLVRRAQVAVAGLVLVSLVLSSSAGRGQEPSAIPAFPARADAITADVVVLDKQGRPVRGLTREDFRLLVDGEPQSIVAFQAREMAPTADSPPPTVGDERVATNEGAGGRGRTFVFLIDDLGDDLAGRQLQLQEAKKTVARWLKEKAHPRDELTLATASGDVFWSDRIDRGRADFLAVLDRIKIHSTWEAGWQGHLVWSRDATPAAASGPRREQYAGPRQTGASRAMDGTRGSGADDTQDSDLLSDVTQRIAERTHGTAQVAQGLVAQEVSASIARKTTALLGATERLSQGLIGAHGRKAIVIFSDGVPNYSGQDRALDASQRANAAVYFVDVKGLGAPALARAEDRNGVANGPGGRPQAAGALSMYENTFTSSGLEMIAENTGGTSVRDTNDLLGGVERIAEESSAYYLLGYQSDTAPDGRWHKLEVKVARPGVKVRTRHGYQAAAPPGVASPSPSKGTAEKERERRNPKRPLDPAVLMSGGADAIPLRLAPYVLDPDEAGRARILLVLEVDTSRLTLHRERTRRMGALDLAVVGMTRDVASVFPLDERLRIDLDASAAGGWMTLTREIRLPPGVAQVRALVRDVASGLAGTVTHRLEVPPLGEPYLTTPIVTDRMIVGGGRGPRLLPVAHRRFRPEGLLYCSYEVVGMTNAQGEATTRVAGGYTLRHADGRIVSQSSPAPIAVALGGKIMRLFALPLRGLEAGEYELVLDVVDDSSGRALQSRERFILG
jgi:VWFA-related protein